MTRFAQLFNITVLTASVFLAASGQAYGSDSEKIPSGEARKASVSTARDISWETSLDKAKDAARLDHKAILWVHMLGNIDGYT